MSCIEIACKEIKQEPTIRFDAYQTVVFTVNGNEPCRFSIDASQPLNLNVQLLHNIPLSLSIVCSLAKIFSCYGGGGWLNNLPWINRDIWKND